MSYHSYNNRQYQQRNQYYNQDQSDPYEQYNRSNNYHSYQQQYCPQFTPEQVYENLHNYQSIHDYQQQHYNQYSNQYSNQYQNYQYQNSYYPEQSHYYTGQNQYDTKQQSNYNQQNYYNQQGNQQNYSYQSYQQEPYRQYSEQQNTNKESKKPKYVQKTTAKVQQKIQPPKVYNVSSNASNFAKTEPQKKQLSSNVPKTKSNSGQQSQTCNYEPGQEVDVKWHNIPKKVGRMNWYNPFKESNVKITESMLHQQKIPNDFQNQSRQYQRHHQSLNIGYQKNNTSYSQNNDHSFDDSINMSQYDESYGKKEVGRYGGDKKHKKRKNNVPSNATGKATTPPPAPKPKVASLIEEASNEGFFAGQTEEIQFSVCPFNPSHIMSRDRLYTHIHRCKQKAPNARQYVNCPYDACHYFLETDIEAHKLVCEKRHLYLVDDSWDTVPNLQESTLDQEQKSITIIQGKEQKPLTTTDPEKQAYDNWVLEDF